MTDAEERIVGCGSEHEASSQSFAATCEASDDLWHLRFREGVCNQAVESLKGLREESRLANAAR